MFLIRTDSFCNIEGHLFGLSVRMGDIRDVPKQEGVLIFSAIAVLTTVGRKNLSLI